jgi:tRNA-specific 2-thiouridylase
MKPKRVAVGLSGGVDSAVAAFLLKQAGYEVAGVHLYCWPPQSEIDRDGITRAEWFKKNGCRADEDRSSALKAALEIGISFKVLDFSEEYKSRVVDYFYREYEAGRTPNPDILCNSEIKFGLFLDWALENGFDYVATGHYAKNEAGKLLIPVDGHKDQTYFLYRLGKKQLDRVLFPLGEYPKASVRKLAGEVGLSAASRPDSQGICFVGDVDVQQFLRRRLVEKPGAVVNAKGEELGTHQGVWFYTIGQRGGWQLNAQAQKLYASEGETPVFYVTAKDATTNRLTVGFGAQTYQADFRISEANWLEKPDKSTELKVRIRHGGQLIPCQLNGDQVKLLEPQRGIAVGQSAVFYSDSGQCLGGGVIE